MFPVAVTMTDGEQPKATKLNALARQAKNGLSVAEYMLGDLWNQAGDSLIQNPGLTNHALMIPNLGRFIGATKYTNPRIPYLPNIDTYRYWFSLDTAGTYEATLTFPPDLVSPAWSWIVGGLDATPKASPDLVIATGNWYVNTDTGKCLFFDPIDTGWKVSYKPRVEGEWDTNTTHNVIPDPDTEATYGFGSCKIAYANNTDNSNGYIIFLPPRGPLASRNLSRFPQTSYDASGNTNNEDGTPDSGAKFFFQQSGAVAAATAAGYGEHYRYNVPKLLSDNWTQDGQLPTGFLYLWDYSQTGTIIEGVAFKAENAATPRTYVIVATGANLDSWVETYGTAAGYPSGFLTARDNHDDSYYPSNGLRLITVGNPLSQTISILTQRLMDHDHSTSSSMPTVPVSHGELANNFDPSDGSGIPQLDASGFDNDWHPQYLHRRGWNSNRDKYNGAMLGNLLIASTNPTTNYNNLTGDSYWVGFGSSSGPVIKYDAGQDVLSISGKPTKIEIPSTIPVSVSPYGYSSSSADTGYGPLRWLYIPAHKFFGFAANGSDPGDISAMMTHDPVVAASPRLYDFVSSAYETMGLDVERNASNPAYYFAEINLPFAKYVIINAEMSCYESASGTIPSSTFYCALGSWARNLTATGDPLGVTYEETDLSTVFSPAGVSFPLPTTVFGISDVNPVVVIDNTNATGGIISYHPWIRFRCPSGAGASLRVRDIAILYRIKEF